MHNVSFGANFKVTSGYPECKMIFEKEGLSSDVQNRLSNELDKITPKKYSLILAYRDRFAQQDTFVLRRNLKNHSEVVSSLTVNMLSKNALSAERLKGIFDVLKLKAHQDYLETRLEQKLAKLKLFNKKELSDKIKMLNIVS